MRWIGAKAFVLGIVLAGLGGAAQSAPIETYQVRDWTISAYSNDESKNFSHCVMYADYKNGVGLLFSVNRDKEWSMGLANNNWHLTQGEKYNFDIQLDGARGNQWFGVAITPTLLQVPLADKSSLFEQFSAARMLTVKAMSATFRFELSNSRVALEAVTQCAGRYIAKENSNPFDNNPFARAPRGPKSKASDEPKADERFYSEAAIVMTNMLSAIGSTGHRLIPVAELPEPLKAYHAAWVSEDAAGTLLILPEATDIGQIASNVLANSSKECDGKFASGKSIDGDKAVKIEVICQDKTGKVTQSDHIVMQRPEGGSFLFSVTAIEGRVNSSKSAAKVGDLIMASVKK